MAKKKAKLEDISGVDSWPVEKCLSELEVVVEALESESTSLDDSLKLFERGMLLRNRCIQELDAVERKIRMIVENGTGQPDFVPITSEDEE